MLVAAALSASLLAPSPIEAAAADAGSSIPIEITADQLVTLRSDSVSLAVVIRDLCAKANVKLRGFEAPDRMVSASYALQ